MDIIEVTNLKKVYQTRTRMEGGYYTKSECIAVDGISFKVERGEILGFIGPNGAGKSTTIKMLSGILAPTDGEITILGMTPMKDRRKLAYRIGAVFGQKSQLSIHLPALDSFRLLGAVYDVDQKKLNCKIDELVESFDLAAFVHLPVRKLSLGQRIRCEIASSLLHDPDLIFLDEPTVGVDVISKMRIREILSSMVSSHNATMILTSHDLGDIEKLCKRVMIINNGRLVYSEAISSLRDKYMHRKTISIRTENEIDMEIKGIEIIQCERHFARLAVDTNYTRIHDVISSITARNQLIDIIVDEIPLEEVISDIYRK